MPTRPLLLLCCLAAPAFADDADCQALRRVLSLAANAQVDVGALSGLEPQVCGRPTRETCQQLGEFWMLSLALGQPQETVAVLEAQRAVWCSRDGEPARALQWTDGRVLRSTTGTLSWPDGTMARSSSGTWSSPEGRMVRSSSGSLLYPQGPIARSTSGRWSLPSGEFTEEGRIASLACAHDVQWCRFFLGEVARPPSITRDFAQLGLGVLAGRGGR